MLKGFVLASNDFLYLTMIEGFFLFVLFFLLHGVSFSEVGRGSPVSPL